MSQIDASILTAPATEPNVPAATVEHEPTATFEAPSIPPKLEPGPSTGLPLAGSVLSAATAAEFSLEDAWGWATHEEREAFVWQHRKQLRAMLAALERQKTTSS